MPKIDINRIVGLDAKFAETIQCPICLSILDNPLMTKCGHNYCHFNDNLKYLSQLKRLIEIYILQFPGEFSSDSENSFNENEWILDLLDNCHKLKSHLISK